MKKNGLKNTNSPQLDTLFGKCLSCKDDTRITARTVYDYCISPFMVYCDKFAPPEKKDQISEFNQLLMEQGKIHEKQVIDTKYPLIQQTEAVNREAGFRLVLESMMKGVSAISGAPVFYLPESLIGVVDVLEKRTEAPSIFGEYHYVVKEIKLAKNIQNSHKLQGAFYNYIIGKIQGYTPSSFYMINRDHDEFENPYDEKALLEIIRDIREILGGKKVSPTYGACMAPWQTFNDEEAIRCRDVSLVGGCGPSFKKLFLENGIETFDQLAKTPESKLTAIKGIGEKTAKKFLNNSKALVQKEHIRIGNCDIFPDKKTEIFLDLEGTGEQIGEKDLIAMDYLIGVILRKNEQTKYIPFLAEDLDKEEEMFKNFVDWTLNQEDFIIYHWHNYERVHLQKMAQRYNLNPEKIELIFSTMRDLYKDATKAFAFPTYGNGLKEIAPYIGYTWKHKEINAMESAAIYLQYAKDKETNKEKMQKVIDYNADDCEATLLIKDWLQKEQQKNKTEN